MKAKGIIIILAMAGLLVFAAVSVLGGSRGKVASTPVLFFSDLTDGPISGWEESSAKGAAVSVWGLNFGSSRGSGYITCGGVNLTSDNDYAEWGVINEPGPGEDPADVYSSARGLERITFWLNSDMNTGPGMISVTTPEGTSNTIPFYCRALGDNHIYFISRDGSDSNSGSYRSQGSGDSGPWFSATKVRGLQAGDVAYFRSGIWNEEDNWSAVIYFNKNHGNGLENKSVTIASYPNEFAQIGDGSISTALRHSGDGEALSYWTFSKFIMRAGTGVTRWPLDADASDDHIRFIGNDGSTHAGGSSVFHIDGGGSGQTYFYFYGNHSHDAAVDNRGDFGNSAYPLYFTGYGFHNYIYVGWNEFDHNPNGRGMQLYGHTSGDWMDNVYIHDNYIHHNGKTGAILGGGDGSSDYGFLRTCYFYNNIVADNGPIGYPGILVGGEMQGGNGGKWYIYNNILYHNNNGEIFYSAGSNPDSVIIKNNIIWPASGERYYINRKDECSIGSNNCYYGGVGNIPGWDLNSMETNPKLLNPDDLDFHLQPTSLCIDAASWDVSSIVTQDYEGISRPQGSAYDIGAHEVLADLPPDTIPPVISNVACSDTTDSGATITWKTNEGSTSQVEYGLTTNYGSATPLNSNLVTNHTQTLNGLKSSTKYYYRVKSGDASDNLAVSDTDSLITKPGQPGQPRWW